MEDLTVIIGNPPYVEYNKKIQGIAISDLYKLVGYKNNIMWETCMLIYLNVQKK